MKFREEYFDEYIGLVVSLASRHFPSAQYDFLDIISAGWNGFAKAVKQYDPKTKVPLKNYAFLFIRSEILKCVYRKGKPSKEHSGYDESLFDQCEGNISDPCEQLMQKEDEEARQNRISSVFEALESDNYVLDKNNELNRRIFKDYYLKGMRIKQLAVKYKLSLPGVQRRVNHVRIIIREYVKKETQNV